jgi:hypothetical protein
MNGCRQRLRRRETAISPSRQRNARVNTRRHAAVANRFVRELVQMSERFPRHAQTCRVFPENKGRWRCNLRCSNRLCVHCDHRRRMRERRMNRNARTADWISCQSALGWRERGYVIEAIPSTARHPTPADVIAVRPRTGMIRSPRPGIRRHPGIARAGIPRPRAVRIGTPGGARKVWPPHRAASACVRKTPVV